jgi:hypothetical protein
MLMWTGASRAATVAEVDFSILNGNDTPLTNTPVGASNTATLVGNATINTGSVAGAPGAAYKDFVRNGFLIVPDRTAASPDGGIITKNDGTGNHHFQDYFGFSGISDTPGDGTGITINFVFRAGTGFLNPNNGTSGLTRVMMDITRFGNSDGYAAVWYQDYVQALSRGVTAQTTNVFGWDTDAWYFIAASFADGAPSRLYIRQLSEDGVSSPQLGFFTSAANIPSGSTRPGNANDNDALTLGGRNQEGVIDLSFGGEYAWARWINTYTASQEEFDAQFAYLLIPEPGVAALTLLGATLMVLWRKH